MTARLAGKVCIITGSGGSVGRAAALAFAREGASVVGCDISVDSAEATVDLVRSEGGSIESSHPCDLNAPSECHALVDLAASTFGRLDVLFNNAALAHFNWLEDITDEEWAHDQRDEVDLVFYLTRAAWPHLKANQGVVVNMASLNASLSFKPLPSLAHTTSKAGIIGMTRQLAMEGREYGIRANSISPGLIETNQTASN
jgi:NAD(P)-dependent dehydrogenase (short-subunit alcohol dehydrogenase family)